MGEEVHLNYQNTCNSTYTERERVVLLTLMGGTGALSVLVCTIAVSLVLSLCLVKQFSYRLALYQVLATLFYSVSMTSVLLLFNYNPTSLYSIVSCKIVAFIIHYSMWVKLLFTLWLSFHLFSYVVFLKNFKKLELLYILFSLLFPLLHSWIPFIHNTYGYAGAWCYIRTWTGNCSMEKYTEGIIEVFVLFYGPIILSLILNFFALLVMFFVLVKELFKSRKNEKEQLLMGQRNVKINALKQLLPLLAYPIIYLFLLISPLIDRIYDAVATKPSYPLTAFHVTTGSLMGVFAGLALITHVCCIRCCVKAKVQDIIHKHQHNQEATSRSQHSSYVVIQNNAGTSTNYCIPRESLLDEEYSQELKEREH